MKEIKEAYWNKIGKRLIHDKSGGYKPASNEHNLICAFKNCKFKMNFEKMKTEYNTYWNFNSKESKLHHSYDCQNAIFIFLIRNNNT